MSLFVLSAAALFAPAMVGLFFMGRIPKFEGVPICIALLMTLLTMLVDSWHDFGLMLAVNAATTAVAIFGSFFVGPLPRCQAGEALALTFMYTAQTVFFSALLGGLLLGVKLL